MKVAVKRDRVAAVAYDAEAVPRFFVKAMCHRIHRGILGQQAFVHQFGRFRFQDHGIARFSILQMGHHELCHVGRTTAEAACGECGYDLKIDRGIGPKTIALRHLGSKIFRQGLRKSRVRHAERLKDVVVYVLGKRFA